MFSTADKHWDFIPFVDFLCTLLKKAEDKSLLPRAGCHTIAADASANQNLDPKMQCTVGLPRMLNYAVRVKLGTH